MIPFKRYAQTQIETASRERILQLLFEAVQRKTADGIAALEQGRPNEAIPHLTRASEIVLELERTLNPAGNSANICDSLAKTYQFVALRLTESALRRDARPARDAQRVFQPIAEAFIQALSQVPANGTAIAQGA
jgi:flagellar protein FliS